MTLVPQVDVSAFDLAKLQGFKPALCGFAGVLPGHKLAVAAAIVPIALQLRSGLNLSEGCSLRRFHLHTPMTPNTPVEEALTANFEVGPSAIAAYSRLSYSMWYALAEFVDNSTQSRDNYGGTINDVLESEGVPLKVEIDYDRENRTLTIRDNSIGMTKQRLIQALKIAPTADSKGRSKYGMGMKTAACWIGNKWRVTTAEWSSGEEWSATVNVQDVIAGSVTVPLTTKKVSNSDHYTRIVIWDLNRNIQKRTEETIMTYLGSMYRNDIRKKRLILLFNGNPVSLPEEFSIAKSDDGSECRETIDTTVGGRKVTGWYGVLSTGGRKFGGFSLFQNDRQIRGYPDAWKPKAVFGGVDDEGSNTLVSQRLTGELVLDGFDVSHTKDAILFRGTEEEDLENYLAQKTAKMKAFATNMRKQPKSGPWSKDKVAELLEGMKKEFGSDELKDVVNDPDLPPLDVIQKNNKKQEEALEEGEMMASLEVGAGITVKVFLQDRTENDPHLTLSYNSDNVVGVIINQQHPYYAEVDDQARADELIRQFIYDAVAEFRAFQRLSQQQPDAVRKLKDQLLRAKLTRIQNQDAKNQQYELEKLSDVAKNNSGT